MENVNKFYLDVLKTKYALFDGRAGRQEFWMFILFSVIVSAVLSIVDGVIGTATSGFGLISGIYSLAVLVPTLALGCQRLHDIGQSGWMQLIGLIPIVGALFLIFVYYIKPGTPGDNKFGANPSGM